jgi:hypothetical protein
MSLFLAVTHDINIAYQIDTHYLHYESIIILSKKKRPVII